ncbi:uncharacterized protein LOC122965487 [Thunnus albacares]|uniref:uncharacterized protein LOC122965487 n=1 Tax=Thunnus albacares TaxID=8236 RepID=UPI001CF69317|nr:uncharacterized protein LOC122965487 [Thunnus albacares]XP_044185533.1 uncharacterized protein LOC122965487 [Thunnus albacares]
MAYITHLDVSFNEAEEKYLQAQDFKKIYVNLNKGAGGKYIYIWYKKDKNELPITRVQVTFNDAMAVGLIKAGYTKINKDLNAGAGGDYIYLWYFRGQTEYDTPIVEIDVTKDGQEETVKFGHDWERLACDLNRKVGGSWLYAWVKREKQTYICEVIARDFYESDADLFEAGFNRVDEDTNRGAGGAFVFIWYRQTTDPKRALSDLHISTNRSEFQALQQQNYEPVEVNLNSGSEGDWVRLWFKKDGSKPIKGITVIVNTAPVDSYETAGVNVIRRNLNTGNDGETEYLCYYH